MAETTDLQRLVVSLDANVKKYERALAKASGTADQQARRIEGRFKRMNTHLSGSFTRLAGSLGLALGGAAAVRGTQTLVDASTRITNALKVAGLEGEDLSGVYDRLFASAQKSAAPLEALVSLYSRAALVQGELNISTEEMLNFTDKIAVALRVSGQSASQSSGALLQLAQALGSGVVRAEEFNSILEGALPIAQAAAAGLDEAGGSVAKLRQLIINGKVSSEAFFRAFESGSVILEEKVGGAELTVSQAFVRLQNVLIKTGGKFNETTGASEAVAGAIDDLSVSVTNLSDNFDELYGPISRAGTWLENFIQDVKEGSRELGKELGTSAVGDWLQDNFGDSALGGSVRFGSESAIQRIQRRSGPGRKPTSAGITEPPAAVKPVSLSDFAAPDGKGGKDKANEYDRLTESILRNVQAMEIEAETFGMTREAATAYRLEQDLINAAQRAGVELSPQQIEDIQGIASAYASAETKVHQFAAAQQELEAIGMEVLGSLESGFVNLITGAQSFEDALGGIFNKLLEIAASQIFQMLISGGFGGGGIGSLLGGLFADGAAFRNGHVTPFANGGVVNKPTLFPMKNGAGLMGEAGPEAVMPLTRLPNGKLGVQAISAPANNGGSAPMSGDPGDREPATYNITLGRGPFSEREVRSLIKQIGSTRKDGTTWNVR